MNVLKFPSSSAALLLILGTAGPAAAQLADDRHWFYDYGAPGSEPFVFEAAGHHLYMGGLFLRVDNDPQKKNLTRFNLLTEAWERVPGIDEDFNGGVWAIENGGDGYLYIGGNFSKVGAVNASGVARLHLATQTWSALTDAAPTLVTPNQQSGPTNGRVLALAKTGNFLYVGGEFTGPAQSPQNEKYIRRFNLSTSTWERVGNGLGGNVRALALAPGGGVAAGGEFPGALAQWNGSAWSVLGGGVAGGVGGAPIVRALAAAPNGTLYIGGDFDQVNAAGAPAAVRDIAALTGTTWNALAGGFDAKFIQSNGTQFDSDGVFDLVLGPNGVLYAAGDFDASAGRAVTGLRHVARWDGTGAWKPLGSGLGVTGSQIVNCLAIGSQGDLYAAGVFNTGFGTLGAAAKNFARWHTGRDFTGYIPGAADNTTLRLAAGAGGGAFTLSFDTRAGTTYQLKASPNFLVWSNVNGGQLVGTGGRMQFNLSGFTAGSHYFRLEAVDW